MATDDERCSVGGKRTVASVHHVIRGEEDERSATEDGGAREDQGGSGAAGTETELRAARDRERTREGGGGVGVRRINCIICATTADEVVVADGGAVGEQKSEDSGTGVNDGATNTRSGIGVQAEIAAGDRGISGVGVVAAKGKGAGAALDDAQSAAAGVGDGAAEGVAQGEQTGVQGDGGGRAVVDIARTGNRTFSDREAVQIKPLLTAAMMILLWVSPRPMELGGSGGG